MLVEYVKDNYYARFHNPSYHKNRESHFNILLNLKSDKVKGARNVGHGYRVKVHACRACQGQ